MTNPKLDKELLLLIHETFPEFCRASHNNSPPMLDGLIWMNYNIDELILTRWNAWIGIKSEDFKEMDGENMIVSNSTDSSMNQPPLLPVSVFSDADFSEDEDTDDIPIGKTPEKYM